MNNGFFGFSGIAPDQKFINISEFDNTGLYTVPAQATLLLIFGVGAGGGGGSGRYGGSAANAGGGGGGGGGAMFYIRYILDDIIYPGSQLFVVIGAGGTGGAAVATSNTNGNAGSVGGDTYIQVNNKAGYLGYAVGGNFGSGGTTVGGTGGAARGSVFFHNYTALVGGGGTAGAIGAKGTNLSLLSPRASGITWHGGAGGGGYTNTGTLVAAGTDIVAGTSAAISFLNPIGYAANAVVAAGGAAGSGATGGGAGSTSNRHICGKLTPGVGGAGGGGGPTTTTGGTGGYGYRGSGGGGGGALAFGATGGPSGAGGRGGNGYVCILAFE